MPSAQKSELRSQKQEEPAEETYLDIIDDPEKLNKTSKEEIVRLAAQFYSGPIPPPQMMAEYEKALPGAADRIIKMAEKQEEHRHYLEKKTVDSESRDSLLGILSAVFISIVILGAGTTIIIVVPGTTGAISGGLLNLFGIATVIGKFLGNSKNEQQAKEDEKEKIKEKTKPRK